MPRHGPCLDRQRPAVAIEVADVFRAHGESYRRAHRLSQEQLATMRAIAACRTAVLGGHVDVCDACGYRHPAYNSCRNRHCPKCQSLAQARWIEQRLLRLLPTHYFHVVFTLPAALRSLALGNRRVLFTLLFQAASQTLLDLGGDRRWLGGLLGVTAVLHTWTRALEFHPHVHCLVTGGGLSPDATQWVATKSRDYLFPVHVLSALFRGKFLHALVTAYRRGKLTLAGGTAELADPHTFKRFVDTLYRQAWVVYAKQPFGGAEQVFRYLGRYTHRVAISNQRLEAFDSSGVRFHTRNGNAVTLDPTEFIRRFLLHVLPSSFVKIRHYGLFAPSYTATKLARAAAILGADLPQLSTADAAQPQAAATTDWRAQLAALTGIDLTRCPQCERGTMIRSPLLTNAPAPRLLPIPDG